MASPDVGTVIGQWLLRGDRRDVAMFQWRGDATQAFVRHQHLHSIRNQELLFSGTNFPLTILSLSNVILK